mmetsp:Transcript_22453/g.47451  ORF Transcript_22453/g.47451 Transcript_22453/m.47451 type:complete len:224 (-) Transcript_22453:4068-4739(-)
MPPRDQPTTTTPNESPRNDSSYGTMSDANDGSSGGDVLLPLPLGANSNENPTGNGKATINYIQIDDAIERVGQGAFQHGVLLAAGMCFMADSMEILLLSFLSTILKHDWGLSEREVDSIIAAVFAGATLGTLVLGCAGDAFGRKPVFAITAFVIAVFGLLTAACTNFFWLVIARFWVGFGVGGLTVPFDTLSEFLPKEARGTRLLSIGALRAVGAAHGSCFLF